MASLPLSAKDPRVCRERTILPLNLFYFLLLLLVNKCTMASINKADKEVTDLLTKLYTFNRRRVRNLKATLLTRQKEQKTFRLEAQQVLVLLFQSKIEKV
jgi:hypothetical protein